jgi:hypothetical protein
MNSKIAIAGLAAILGATASHSGEIKTAPHPDEVVWMADGGIHRMGVYADNTGVAPGLHTDLVTWRIYNHSTFSPLYRGFEIPPIEHDFFNGVPTEDIINGLGTGSFRMTLGIADGPLVGEGQGFLVFYRFQVPENTQVGIHHFPLSPSSSNTYMNNEDAEKQQPVIISAEPITVIPSLPAMADATQGPGIPSNSLYDFNSDGDVDLHDWAAAQVESSQERN